MVSQRSNLLGSNIEQTGETSTDQTSKRNRHGWSFHVEDWSGQSAPTSNQLIDWSRHLNIEHQIWEIPHHQKPRLLFAQHTSLGPHCISCIRTKPPAHCKHGAYFYSATSYQSKRTNISPTRCLSQRPSRGWYTGSPSSPFSLQSHDFSQMSKRDPVCCPLSSVSSASQLALASCWLFVVYITHPTNKYPEVLVRSHHQTPWRHSPEAREAESLPSA